MIKVIQAWSYLHKPERRNLTKTEQGFVGMRRLENL